MTSGRQAPRAGNSAAEIPHLTSADQVDASAEYLARVPIEWARRMRALPVLIQGQPYLLMEDLSRHELLDDISLLLEVQAVPVQVDTEFLDQVIERMYFQELRRDQNWEAQPSSDSEFTEDQPSLSSDLLSSAEAGPVVQFVNETLLDAVREGASDIHIEPEVNQLRIRFRVDGLLHEYPSPPRGLQMSITARIKVMASLDIAEKRLPQDGTARVRVGRKELDIRVSTIPVADGERIVLRILHREQLAMGLSDLGLPSDLLAQLRQLLKEPNGVIWVTGPTGSGKTTTLYAALMELDRERLNILTIEDPVEYRLEGIGQMSVKPAIGLTFAAGLRHVLRQDPDVVLVGETRDEETAEIVTRASLTGHLVFSTLHTNSAGGVFTRLLDMNVPAYLLTGSIRASLGQRLVRKLCPNCRKRVSPESELSANSFFDRAIFSGTDLYEANGCDQCRDGYHGRVGIYELLVMTDELKQEIKPGCTLASLTQSARKTGFRTLKDDGIQKVRDGLTTIAELERVLGQSN